MPYSDIFISTNEHNQISIQEGNKMGYYLKKSEVKKLEYNTLAKVEKKYKEIKENIFDFSGFNTEVFEELQKSVYMIFQSMRGESEASIGKMLAGKENRIKSFDEFVNHRSSDYQEYLNIFFQTL